MRRRSIEEEANIFEYKPIGHIHSPYKSAEETPIQPVFAGDAPGRVVVFEEYAAGLRDLEGFSHVVLVYHFHESGAPSMLRKPLLDSEEKGLFATRFPARPNPIGISVVRLVSVQENVLEVEGIDVLDGTPLLDIKPFVPGFRAPGPVKTGWLDGKLPPGEDGVPS